jgi:twinkle protein
MSEIVERHVACPCGKSSDAYCKYSDGHGHCFSCGATHTESFPEQIETGEQLDGTYTYEFIPWRSVTKETMAAYGVRTKVNAEGKPVSLGFPYSDDTFKVRDLAEKKFYAVGQMSTASLFGASLFSAGQSKAITITEGEMDALSAFQMLGSKYPVVSVRGATSAKKDCSLQRDYLNAFDRIYLCFDNDEPGQKAAQEVASIFDPNKVYHVKLTRFKDANEYLEKGDAEEFRHVWFNSKRYGQRGILSSLSDFRKILSTSDDRPAVPYPFPTLQQMTYGLRQGEVSLFTALEGTGKTEIIRCIEHSILKNTDMNIGVIHLEEPADRCLKGLAGYDLQAPCHLPDSGFSKEDIDVALTKLIGRDDRLHYCQPPDTDDPDEILDKFRFLATSCDCKYISLDLITVLVTGRKKEDQTQVLDYLSTKAERMSEDLGFGLIMVSHVNDEGETRGSRNISKACHTWVHLDRNVRSGSNITSLNLNKNRFGAKTGPAGHLIFDPSTFMMQEKTAENVLPT